MGPLCLTVTSVARSVSSEKGALFLSMEGDVSKFEVRTARASGVHLQALSVLSSLLFVQSKAGTPNPALHGQKTLPPGSVVTVVVDPGIHDAVVELAASGRVVIGETISPFTALAKLMNTFVSRGVDLRFVPGVRALSVEEDARLEVAVSSLVREAEAAAAEQAAWTLPVEDAAWVAEMGAQVVYTDGSCVSATGFTSWAWISEDGRSGSGTVAAATSSYAERRAALEALRAVSGPVLLVTDLSELVIDLSSRVLPRQEKLVLKSLRRLVRSRQVRILTVKGHSACPGNIAVDQLAGETLAAAWAKVSGVAGLQDRLVTLSVERKANLKVERRLANERRMAHELRYGVTVSERRRARALRKKKRAARALAAA